MYFTYLFGYRRNSLRLRLLLPFFFFFFFEALFSKINAFLVGSVHCSRDLQTSFFNKTFIKNEFHDTIYTFKNYFITMFSVFNF